MSTRIGSAFVPVHDTARSAAWYSEVFGVAVDSVGPASAVLSDPDGHRVTLLGPPSGIRATPGLPWSSCSFLVDDVAGFRARSLDGGVDCGPVQGDPDVCLFVTVQDPDGNVVLVVDR